MESPEVYTLGQYLRREREFRDVTLEEISRKTKVHINLLSALEGDEYKKLPGHTFIKGFLKSYAGHVGLDFNDILLRFDKQILEMTAPEESTQTYASARIGKKVRYGIITLVVIGLVILAAYLSSH